MAKLTDAQALDALDGALQWIGAYEGDESSGFSTLSDGAGVEDGIPEDLVNAFALLTQQRQALERKILVGVAVAQINAGIRAQGRIPNAKGVRAAAVAHVDQQLANRRRAREEAED